MSKFKIFIGFASGLLAVVGILEAKDEVMQWIQEKKKTVEKQKQLDEMKKRMEDDVTKKFEEIKSRIKNEYY